MRVVIKTLYYIEDEDYKEIIKCMKDNKLTYRKIAKELGISSTFLHDMIHYRRPISMNVVNYFKSKGVHFVWEED